MPAGSSEERWLSAFHAGEGWAIEACYREHAPASLAAARRLVGSVDAETVTHEVFYRLLSSAKTRESFRGGSIGAWLVQVAVRSAIDDLRRRRRETSGSQEGSVTASDASVVDEEVEAKILIERFRRERLPPEWAGVFDARFIRQLPQRDAARELGLPRTTLVYQEQRLRGLLRRFLLDDEAPGLGGEGTKTST